MKQKFKVGDYVFYKETLPYFRDGSSRKGKVTKVFESGNLLVDFFPTLIPSWMSPNSSLSTLIVSPNELVLVEDAEDLYV